MTEPKTKTEYIVVQNTIAEGWHSAARTLVILFATIGVGTWMQSPAMQWMGFLFIILIAVVAVSKRPRMTRAEAIKYLQDQVPE